LHTNSTAENPHIDKLLYPISMVAAIEKKEFVAKNP
jgi:hypothetical protein